MDQPLPPSGTAAGSMARGWHGRGWASASCCWLCVHFEEMSWKEHTWETKLYNHLIARSSLFFIGKNFISSHELPISPLKNTTPCPHWPPSPGTTQDPMPKPDTPPGARGATGGKQVQGVAPNLRSAIDCHHLVWLIDYSAVLKYDITTRYWIILGWLINSSVQVVWLPIVTC